MGLIDNSNNIIIPTAGLVILGVIIYVLFGLANPNLKLIPTTSTTTIPPPPNAITVFGQVGTSYGTSPYQITFTNSLVTKSTNVNTKNYSQFGNYSVLLQNMKVYKVTVYWNSTAPLKIGGTGNNCTPSKSTLSLNIVSPNITSYNFSISC